MIIYKITNLVNNKIYIGQTVQNLRKRWRQHTYDKRSLIYKVFKKYGKKNLKIEQIDKAVNQSELNQKEKFWASRLNSYVPHGYNLAECGGSSGNKHPKTIYKMAKNYTIKSRSGKIIKVRNLKKFCEENNLDVCHMYKVVKGLRKQHKGWSISTAKFRHVLLINPKKELIKLDLYYGSLSEFCKINNLDFHSFYHLIYDIKAKTSQNWLVLERFID